MSYEIDFISVDADECKQNADAIAIRWATDPDEKTGNYHIGIIDGGFEAHGRKLVDHINRWYFNDPEGLKSREEKPIEFVLNTHPDQDHTVGLNTIIENFNVQALYMNRPWKWIDTLYNKVNDGRITINSLNRTLHEKFSFLADLEDTARKRGVKIYDAFKDSFVDTDGRFTILSPSRDFYLEMLAESEKTPDMTEQIREYSESGRATRSVADEVWAEDLLDEQAVTDPINETSVVLYGSIDDGFLLTGDAGVRALNKAMDCLDSNDVDIQKAVSFLQIPHHGGRHNVNPATLDRMIGPIRSENDSTGKEAFVSVTPGNDHPKPTVVNAYIRRGVTVYKTRGGILTHRSGNMRGRNWANAVREQFQKEVEI